MPVSLSNHCDAQEFLQSVRLDGLLQFNVEQTDGRINMPCTKIVRVARDENGIIVGGISGSTYLSSLEIEVLWVHEAYRGRHIASRLLEEAEAEARKDGCRISHLTTFSFQAPLFYQKHGYAVCGEIDGFPDGIKLHVLQKTL